MTRPLAHPYLRHGKHLTPVTQSERVAWASERVKDAQRQCRAHPRDHAWHLALLSRMQELATVKGMQS